MKSVTKMPSGFIMTSRMSLGGVTAVVKIPRYRFSLNLPPVSEYRSSVHSACQVSGESESTLFTVTLDVSVSPIVMGLSAA